MAPEVLYRVLFSTTKPPSSQTSTLVIRPALLLHYTRHRVIDCDYPAILPNSSTTASVRGTLVTGLTDKHVWRLDLFEGSQYRRVKVKCQVLTNSAKRGEEEEEGEEQEAETYVWYDQNEKMGRNGLEEREWDFEEFRREKMKRWIGGEDTEYAEVDEAVEKGMEDPTGGRGMDGEMERKLNGVGEGEGEILKSAV